MILNRDGPIPLYKQLKEILVAQIQRGDYDVGDPLPSERALCKTYDLSRSTVRQALRELARDGLVRRVPAAGSFVTANQSHLTISVSLAGFSANVRQLGLEPSSRLLRISTTDSPPAHVMRELNAEGEPRIMMVERLRLVDDAPLAIHTVYLNHALCPQLRQEDLAGASLANVLREVCGLQPARADERVYAALANQREIDMLQLSYPASVLRKVRRTYLSDGSMIEYSLASYCGERYRMRLDLEAL